MTTLTLNKIHNSIRNSQPNAILNEINNSTHESQNPIIKRKKLQTYVFEKKPLIQKKKIVPPIPSTLKERVADIQNWILEHYPRAFNLENPIPLKIGILKDIRALPNFKFSVGSLRGFLASYTKRGLYLEAVINQKLRCDLNGDAWEDVSQKELLHTTKVLEAFKRKQEKAKVHAKLMAKKKKSK